jgi:hypothetical protein
MNKVGGQTSGQTRQQQRRDKRKDKKQQKKLVVVKKMPQKLHPSDVRNKSVASKAAGDSRATPAMQQQLMASGVSNAVNQIFTASTTVMNGVGYAYVCAALQRGWMSNSPASNFPFAAWVYTCTVWQNFMNGTIPQGTQLPYWMWAVGRAIAPKACSKGAGQIYFKAINENAAPATALFPCGPSAFGYSGNLYIAGGGSTDGFPDAESVSLPPAETQEVAFNAMCGFMVKEGHTPSVMCDQTVKTIFDKDVSAFCSLLSTTGYGAGGAGGAGFIAALEVPIHTPWLSPLLSPSTTTLSGPSSRFYNRDTFWAGDEMLVGAFLPLMPVSHWKTKKAPKFKFIDFVQIQEVVALWISKAVNQYWLDPAMNVVSQAGTVAQVPAQTVCPITLQEMGLLLRNEVIFALGPTQSAVQSLLPILPASAGDNQFMPYLTGSTGCAVQSIGMKLPQILVENLRALIIHQVRGVNKTGKLSRDIEYLYPVLGQYNSDVLVTGDYTFNTVGLAQAVVTTNTFTETPPMLLRRRVSKSSTQTEVWAKVETETVINFIDTDNGTHYVFINDPARLKRLATLWNDYVSTFAAYSSPLTVLSLDPGTNVLTSVNQTRHWTVPSSKALAREADFKDLRMNRSRGQLTSPYSTRNIYAISYREEPFQATSSITTNWILPVNFLQAGTSSATASAFTKIQSMLGEEFSTTTSTTGDTGISMADLNADFASAMVHAKGVESALDAEFTALSKAGQSGILSSLVSGFAHGIGGPIGDIVGAIGNILPI